MSHDTTYSDGYRNNDCTVEHITYGSAQYQLSPDDTLLLDAKTDFYEAGDTDAGFDPHANDPDTTLELDDYLVRFGIHHRFGPGNQVVGQLLANDADFTFDDPTYNRLARLNLVSSGEIVDSADLYSTGLQHLTQRSRGIRAEAQHIFDSRWFSLVTGAASNESSEEFRENGRPYFEELESEYNVASRADNTAIARRVYNYTTLHLAP